MLPEEEIALVDRGAKMPDTATRYLFCQGMLMPHRLVDQTPTQTAESFMVNVGSVIKECDRLIETNPNARICVIGSESGFAWSFDGAYAASKAALHRYVEARRVKWSMQQLVCIAPGIVEDAGMTRRRKDADNLDARRAKHPKGRFLTSAEVASLVHHVLYVDQGYICNTVIRVNGGEHLA
jgi:NAD(P)-dependent dehydrogenase (short-subunit alcohol dehydrogenase family)